MGGFACASGVGNALMYCCSLRCVLRGRATFSTRALPCTRIEGELIPLITPALRCRTRISLFNILLTGNAYMVHPVPIRLHGSLRAALPKYFISACSKARMFRLRCYVLYGLIISEWVGLHALYA